MSHRALISFFFFFGKSIHVYFWVAIKHPSLACILSHLFVFWICIIEEWCENRYRWRNIRTARSVSQTWYFCCPTGSVAAEADPGTRAANPPVFNCLDQENLTATHHTECSFLSIFQGGGPRNPCHWRFYWYW